MAVFALIKTLSKSIIFHMNNIISRLISVTALLCFPAILFSSEIAIEIEGLRSSKGKILIGVYNQKDKFPKDGGSILNIVGEIANGKAILQAKNLPPGEYAFALLHDENGNSEMDYNWLGIPKEGFGFSRNPSMGLSAPSFEETKINFNGSAKTIKIKVKYM